ncbi:MAG TPA: hypothetical protein VI670_12925 [Thermoanaerobaculia bacterium]|jgi:hypothetical protein
MARRVTSSAGCGAALLWALAAAWISGIAFFAVVVARSEIATPMGAWAALALFAIAGLFLTMLAIRATIDAARFRGVSVELHTDPGVAGGKLAGFVHGPMPLQMTLRNWNDDEETLVWESMPLDVDGGAFAFDVPFDCEGTSWRLVLATRDGRHSASFPVPMMRTEASSPAQTRLALREAAYEAPAKTRVNVERGYAGTTVRLPLPSWIAAWYLIALLVAAAAYLCSVYLWHDMPGIAIVVAIVLAIIPLPTFAMTVRRIDADLRGLTLHYLLRGPKRIAVADVGAAYASGALHYELTFDGKTPSWTVLTLRSRAEAEWVAYELRRALSLGAHAMRPYR